MAKIPRVPVENQITTLSVVKIAIKFSPCILSIYYTFGICKKKNRFFEARTWDYILKQISWLIKDVANRIGKENNVECNNVGL